MTGPAGGEATALVAVADLEVRYQRGPQAAVGGVSFAIGPGEGLLLAGGAGSGKSSVIRAVLGLAPATGEVTLLGRPPGDAAALRRVGYAPQRWPFTPGVRAREVARLVAGLRGLPDPAAAADDAMARAGLEEVGRSTDRLPIEDVRRLCLACAIAGDPEVLVLDDPWEFPETEREVRAARARGAAVLAASVDPGGLPRLLGRTLTLADGGPRG